MNTHVPQLSHPQLSSIFFNYELCVDAYSQHTHKSITLDCMRSAHKEILCYVQRFEHSNAIKIHYRIMFDFYPGLQHKYLNGERQSLFLTTC